MPLASGLNLTHWLGPKTWLGRSTPTGPLPLSHDPPLSLSIPLSSGDGAVVLLRPLRSTSVASAATELCSSSAASFFTDSPTGFALRVLQTSSPRIPNPSHSGSGYRCCSPASAPPAALPWLVWSSPPCRHGDGWCSLLPWPSSSDHTGTAPSSWHYGLGRWQVPLLPLTLI